ncbi:MAG: type II secretion system F family protein, partial [Candidatus Omnitrophota bacterium]
TPVLLAAGYKFYYSTPGGRYVIDNFKLKLPVFGELLRKIALSRFCRTFAISLKSGVTVLSSLDIANEVVGNIRLERSVAKARDSVNVGEKISTSLQATGDFPPLVVRMISVGEQSGSLPEALDKVNLFYDREVPATIKMMFTLFEPAMIVVIGVVVGGIAISVLLPMFQLAQVIGD